MGQSIEPVQESAAKLMQSGIGQLHLRLDPGCPRDAVAGCLSGYVVEQRRLSDPGLVANQQRRASPFTQVADDAVELGGLTMPPDQLTHVHHERDPSRQFPAVPEVRRLIEYAS